MSLYNGIVPSDWRLKIIKKRVPPICVHIINITFIVPQVGMMMTCRIRMIV